MKKINKMKKKIVIIIKNLFGPLKRQLNFSSTKPHHFVRLCKTQLYNSLAKRSAANLKWDGNSLLKESHKPSWEAAVAACQIITNCLNCGKVGVITQTIITFKCRAATCLKRHERWNYMYRRRHKILTSWCWKQFEPIWQRGAPGFSSSPHRKIGQPPRNQFQSDPSEGRGVFCCCCLSFLILHSRRILSFFSKLLSLGTFANFAATRTKRTETSWCLFPFPQGNKTLISVENFRSNLMDAVFLMFCHICSIKCETVTNLTLHGDAFPSSSRLKKKQKLSKCSFWFVHEEKRWIEAKDAS